MKVLKIPKREITQKADRKKGEKRADNPLSWLVEDPVSTAPLCQVITW